MKTLKFALFSLLAVAQLSFAQERTVMVCGAPMYPSKNIVENLANSSCHTIAIAALKATSVFETLSGSGPYTLFAPTDKAFDQVPGFTVQTQQALSKEEKRHILLYHIVIGKISAADLMKAISDGSGKATLTTAAGGTLTAMRKGKIIQLTDAKGGTSTVTIADVFSSNGVFHVVDKILMP